MQNLAVETDVIVNNINQYVKRASCVADTIFNEYYSDADATTENGKARMILGFDFASIEHDIIIDYLDKIKQEVQSLIGIIGDAVVEEEGVRI